jgi:hypothetical protein
MVDVLSLWPLRSLPDRLPPGPRGRKIHRASGFRWASRGVRGRRLRTVSIGGSLFSCDQWLHEFVTGTAASGVPDGRPDDSDRQDRILAAEAELRAMGI